ncbi:MAG: DNA repair protein RadC [Clostridia bacterium]|nr:DNA repair protein RadC [Clostridia bacterium]
MSEAAQKQPHRDHRKRVRDRCLREGLESFAPHEVLELLLFYARTRGDTNPVAHALLDTFGSLRGVLEASPQQLMQVPGVGEEAAVLISMAVPLFRVYTRTLAEKRPKIASTEAAREYAFGLLAGQRAEQFFVICLGADRSLLGVRKIASGTVTEVAAYPRAVAEAALTLNAHGVILCHNHPDGLCEPSPEDIDTTHRLWQLLEAMDIRLLDHVIVAGDAACSLAERGELKPRIRKGR